MILAPWLACSKFKSQGLASGYIKERRDLISYINVWCIIVKHNNMGGKRRRKNYGVESKDSHGQPAVGTSPGPYRTKKFAWDPFGTWSTYTVVRIHHVMLVRGCTRYHVEWKDIPESGWTWEPEANLQDDQSRALLEAFKADQAKLEKVMQSMIRCTVETVLDSRRPFPATVCACVHCNGTEPRVCSSAMMLVA
jgi:hypothetical protein